MFSFALRLEGSVGPVWCPSGNEVAVSTAEGVAVVRIDAPESAVVLGPPGALHDIAWSPDGRDLAIASFDDGWVRRVCVADGSQKWQASVGGSAIELAWAHSGRSLACLTRDVVVCDAETGAVSWRHDRHRTRGSVSVTTGGVIERYDSEPVWPDAAAWSPDSALLAVRWPDGWTVLDARDGRVVAEGQMVGAAIRWTHEGLAAFESGANRLALFRLPEPIGTATNCYAFSADGRYLALEGREHALLVHDRGETITLPGHPRTITAMDWSATGVLATACRDGVLRRTSAPWRSLQTWAKPAHRMERLTWSPRGTHLAVRCDTTLLVLSEARHGDQAAKEG